MGEKIKIDALILRSYLLFVVGGRSSNMQESLAPEGDKDLLLAHLTLVSAVTCFLA